MDSLRSYRRTRGTAPRVDLPNEKLAELVTPSSITHAARFRGHRPVLCRVRHDFSPPIRLDFLGIFPEPFAEVLASLLRTFVRHRDPLACRISFFLSGRSSASSGREPGPEGQAPSDGSN
jgi:hypothetical protein